MTLKSSVVGGLLVAYLATYTFGGLAVRHYWRDRYLEMLEPLAGTAAYAARVQALQGDVRHLDRELRIKRLFPVAPFLLFNEFDYTGMSCGYGRRQLMLWYGSRPRVLIESL